MSTETENRVVIRRPLGLQITSAESCEFCDGTGLTIKQEHDRTFNKISISLLVCSCVRLQRSKKVKK